MMKGHMEKMPRLVAERHAEPAVRSFSEEGPALRSFSEGGFAESAKLEHLSSVAFPTFVALAKKVAKDEAIKANLRRWDIAGDFSTNGAAHTSQGQRPGYASSFIKP
jgi:hypothetical protein